MSLHSRLRQLVAARPSDSSADQLRGYKLQGRDWRVPRSALRAFLDAQEFNRSRAVPASDEPRKVDLGAWRKLRE